MVVYMCQCYILSSSTLAFLLVHKAVLYVCVSEFQTSLAGPHPLEERKLYRISSAQSSKVVVVVV